VFQNRPFQRFARKERIDVASLCDAVERAEAGQLDADLGGGVIKQRIPRPNEGKSGGFRSIILYRTNALAFFVYGFPKSERGNITEVELNGFKLLAKVMLSYNEKELESAMEAGALMELICNE